MQITLLNLLNIGSQPPTEELWLIPGNLEDRHSEDGKYLGWYIEDYLRVRGILLQRGLNEMQSRGLIGEVRAKFESAGFEVLLENTVND